MRMFEASAYLRGSLGPDEGFWVFVPGLGVQKDGALEGRDAREGSSTDGFLGDPGEPTFDEVEPGGAGWCQMEVEPRVFSQPRPDDRMFVRAVVVTDQMDLPAPVLSGGEAWADRQDRLCSIQRLNLRFLINAEHQSLFWRVQIEPDDVRHLAIKLRVRAELEGFHPMRLESMLLPDPVHRHVADLQLPRQTARAPVRRRFGRSHRCRHDPGLVGRRYPPRTAAAMPCVKSRNPFGEEASSPLAHGHLRDPKPLRHRPNTDSVGARQDHPSPFGDLLRRRGSPHPALQNPPVTHRQMKLRSHISHDTENQTIANVISVTQH